MTANDRVRARIKEWVEANGHGSQRQLAQHVLDPLGEPRSDQWASDIINGRSDLTLRDLDQVADHLDVPPGWLVRKHDRNYDELTMAETKVVTFFRLLPDTVRRAWLLVLDYLATTKIQTRRKVLPLADQPQAQSVTSSTQGVSSHALVAAAPRLVSRDEWNTTLTQLIADTVASLERLQTLAESTAVHPALSTGDGAAPSPPPGRAAHRKAAHWGRRKS